jgi:DNA repair protein RecO (recombination protein O)
MIEKVEAICIKISPFSKTSHIVSWLTDKHGLIQTVIKGAQRPKSWFIGQYDLFQTCEVLFYTRSHNNLHIIKECTPLIPRIAFHSDWRAAAIASYFCDLIYRNSFGNTHMPEYYELLETSLDALITNGTNTSLMPWYELNFLSTNGLSPTLNNCVSCGKPINIQPSYAFSIHQGGIVCSHCITKNNTNSTTVTPDIIALLKSWQRASSPATAINIKPTRKQTLAFRSLLGIFIAYHLDMNPVSRRAAVEISSV